MSRTPARQTSTRSWLRGTLVSGLAALAVTATLPAGQALAATPPAAPTSGTGTVGDRVLHLSWSGGAGTGAVVRDITGVASPYTTASGRDVPVASPSTAEDTGFTNTRNLPCAAALIAASTIIADSSGGVSVDAPKAVTKS